jgi:hypothetical protein
LASNLTSLSLTPGNFPATPVTVKVASVPEVTTAFLMAALWESVNNGEPNENVDDTRTASFSVAVATGLATSPASDMTKLVIRIVTRIETLRMLEGSLVYLEPNAKNYDFFLISVMSEMRRMSSSLLSSCLKSDPSLYRSRSRHQR